MKLKILGSVAPHCNEKNNCPGYLLETAIGGILLDCGNGITKVLNLEKDIDKINYIIISHAHKDHYGDLLSVSESLPLYQKFGYLTHQIHLLLPKANKKGEKILLDDEYLREIGKRKEFITTEYNEEKNFKIKNIEISFYMTRHPLNTYAIKVKEGNDVFVYSADTGYDENMVEFIKEANIFLCESSFLKGQNREENAHLFAHEAGKLAKKGKVDKLILTHFWPNIEHERYLEEAQEEFFNTEAAEEGKVYFIRESRKDGRK